MPASSRSVSGPDSLTRRIALSTSPSPRGFAPAEALEHSPGQTPRQLLEPLPVSGIAQRPHDAPIQRLRRCFFVYLDRKTLRLTAEPLLARPVQQFAQFPGAEPLRGAATGL